MEKYYLEHCYALYKYNLCIKGDFFKSENVISFFPIDNLKYVQSFKYLLLRFSNYQLMTILVLTISTSILPSLSYLDGNLGYYF